MPKPKRKPKSQFKERRVYVDDPLWQRSRIASIRLGVSNAEFVRRALKRMLESVEGVKLEGSKR
jgi:hypothetical protein